MPRDRAKTVVFLGDYNVDIIMDGLEAAPEPDREIGCASFDVSMGASCCIAAAAYARLGGTAAVCGLSGDDEFGSLVQRRLEEAGVQTGLVRRDAAQVTGATVNLVRGIARYQVTYPGSMGRFSIEHVPQRMYEDLRHLHVAGVYQARSLLPHVEAILARASSAGATVSLDCQWDPSERWEGLARWLPHVDWLFANEQEACSMSGKTGAEEALTALAARTACPVVKAGSRGAWLMEEGRSSLAAAAPVKVVDTIGAGDNFDAGFLYAVIEKGLAPGAAARHANAAAGRSCAFRGGTAARSSWDDVVRFMAPAG